MRWRSSNTFIGERNLKPPSLYPASDVEWKARQKGLLPPEEPKKGKKGKKAEE
jgi:hypothetical protein